VIAFPEIFHIAPDALHNAARLMAQQHQNTRVVLPDPYIRMADPAGYGLYQRFIRTRFFEVKLFDDEILRRSRMHGGLRFHGFLPADMSFYVKQLYSMFLILRLIWSDLIFGLSFESPRRGFNVFCVHRELREILKKRPPVKSR
jgi:hypothetical protein